MFILIIPYFLIILSKKSKLEGILSPVVLCYALGLSISNFLPDIFNINIIKTITDISVILAIPLILMNSDFKGLLSGTKNILISFLSAILSAVLICICGAVIFKNQISNSSEVAAMLTGVYTGGTPNMASIKLAIGADENTYVALNISDIILSGIYLIFLTSIGVKFYRWLFPNPEIEENDTEQTETNKWKQLNTKQKIKQAFLPILIAIVIVGITMGINAILFEKDNLSFIIISITILGVLISFLPFSEKLEGSYQIGDYLLLVFSVALGMQSDFSEIMTAGSAIILFTAFVVYGSIALHLVISKLFKIDADTVMITSTACIFGPIFIGQIVSVLKNKTVLVPGMAMGVVGIAIGNFLGLMVFYIVQYIT